MNEKLQKGIKDLRDIRLTQNEKAGVLERVLTRSPYAPVRSLWLVRQLVLLRRHASAFALLIVIALGTGTAIASESALPGGILYQIKVNITEPARDIVKIIPEEKIEWEVKKAERRLEEVELLSAEGNLDEQKIEKIEALFDKHTETFKAKAEEEIKKHEKEDRRQKNIEEDKEDVEVRVKKNKTKAREVMEKRLEDLEKAREKTLERAKKKKD